MNDMKSAAFGEAAEFSYFNTLCMQPKAQRVGLLGGTFNPVHNGHICMACIALDEFLLGEVVFLPLGTPPHKLSEHIASAEHRLAMLNLAIQGENRFSVSTLEIFREGVTYTVDTLESLCRLNPKTEYYYIIGADTLFELPSWKSFERVITLARFICVLRPGVDDQSARAFAHTMNKKHGERVFIAQRKGPDISSSLIRNLAVGNKLPEGFLPKSVAEYIRLNRIYIMGD